MISVILLAIPVFFLTIGIDWVVGILKGKRLYYRFADTITNLNMGVGQQAVNITSKALILGAYDYVYHHAAMFSWDNSWIVILICIILFDFIYYWAHRWGHEINFFWGAHIVHHQSEEYNLSVALRQSWFHNLIAFPLFLPLALLGFSTMIVGGVAVFITLYQYWIHTQAIGKLPAWIEFIFNTPSHHRVHHGVNPKYIDKNHGAFLIIWDRLFGTFQEEEEPPCYGITTRFPSMNPVWANVHYYVEMAQKAKKLRTWREKIFLIWARPGWLPEYLGGSESIKPIDTRQRLVYDPPIAFHAKMYVAFQFVLIIGGIISYMVYFDILSLPYRILFLIAIISSLTSCGGILEKKNWAVIVEIARLTLSALSLLLYFTHQNPDRLWITLPMTGLSYIGSLVWLYHINKTKETAHTDATRPLENNSTYTLQM